jgi:putative transcriptional regulator
MNKFSKELIESLTQACEHAEGEPGGVRVHTVEVPDVRAVRKQLRMSQQEFARVYRIPLATLKNWEQGRRQPDAPAAAYLQVIARRPRAARDALLHRAVAFPFVRDRFYPIAELRAFEAELRIARQGDRDLTEAIRGRKLTWAKLWTEELFPLWLYANHDRLPDEDEFRIMPEGHPVDAELRTQSHQVTRFQITTAYPEWDVSGSDPRSGGYIRHMERVGINQGAAVFGGGRIGKDANGQTKSEPRARSPNIDRCAWQRGLIKAIDAKISKSVSETVEVLLVYAERLRFNTIDDRTENVVLPAIGIALQGVQTTPFEKIIVLDEDPLAYVEYPGSPGASKL